jgi:hypothetical protein
MGLLSERSEDDEERGEISIAGLEDLDGGRDEAVYELDDWSERGRTLLRERLDTLAVPHSWEDDTTLVVAATDEAWVERIMDQVEDDLSESLDPELPQVAYDLAEWDRTARERFYELLDEEAVPFGVDGDELFVHEIDEARVDELVEAVLHPEEASDGGSGDPEAMGQLFVAADLLAREPESSEGALTLVDARRASSPDAVPYGMDSVWWGSVLEKVDALLVLLDEDTPDDDSVVERSVELRDGLRPYV